MTVLFYASQFAFSAITAAFVLMHRIHIVVSDEANYAAYPSTFLLGLKESFKIFPKVKTQALFNNISLKLTLLQLISLKHILLK